MTFRVNVDPQELGALQRDLKELEGGKAMVTALRRNLKAAAQPAVRQVKANASWSTRIPAATAARVAFTAKRGAGMSVFVNRKKAPHARPIENDGSPGSFQHFVFGHAPLVTQAARPFFFDQMDKAMPAVEAAVADAMEEAAKAAGFR